LDKNSKNGRTTLVHLYMRAHFFILPTRAECMGISLSEAAAFGLPLIATDTGGVSTIVKNGKNGILLGYNDSPVFIAMKIYELWKNKEKYRAMCMESRNYYDEKICADVWATSVNAIIEELVTRH
jgi:glycosyltransferase involved in cell wall biosynthesis